jgi:hypothetical protein
MQPKHLLPFALLAGLSLACTNTESGKDPDSTQSSGEAQAERVRKAQEQARQDAIDDLYEQWRYEYVLYRTAVAQALAAEPTPSAPGEPIRSVEELLRVSDPEGHDPAAQALRAQWLEASQDYDLRLRQLENDPERDPRSPLRPEVRASLVPPPSPR